MPQAEEIKLGQELMQSFLRARKNLRIYPANNPVYGKTVEDAYRKVIEYLDLYGDLDLKLRQNEILLGDKPVFQSVEKEDNLAFILFKDGVRELSLQKGLAQNEMKGFLEAISYDFDKGDDEDVVTLFWERDFDHVKYIVDENFLLEDETYEASATMRAREEETDEGELRRAYEEALKEQAEARVLDIVPITRSDLDQLVKEIEKDSGDKIPRLTAILIDMLVCSDGEAARENLKLICGALEYAVQNGLIYSAVHILQSARKTSEDPNVPETLRREMEQVFLFASSPPVIKRLGEELDSGNMGDLGILMDYVRHLGREAISSFITILGELKTIEARKTVIDALALLGEKDINALAKGLSDPRWYVVRNIIYIFRKIGDRRAVDFLIRAARHSDVRVRMEVIKAFGELGGQGVIQTIRDALDDPEQSVRTAAARALGQIKSEAAKKIIMNRLTAKEFVDLDFNEKKEFFEVLSSWNESGVVEFLLRNLRVSSFFRKGRYDEIKACAAYSLGLMGCKEALPSLHRLRESKNRLLSEYAYTAIKRIEYGK